MNVVRDIRHTHYVRRGRDKGESEQRKQRNQENVDALVDVGLRV